MIVDLPTVATLASALACGSWIFLGSNGIMLGGAGGMLGLLGLCCRQRCHVGIAACVMGCAAALHFAAFALGVTAIQFYLTKPGKDWGPSIFGDGVHGAWWWVGLSFLLCLGNLVAGVLDAWLIGRKCTHTDEEEKEERLHQANRDGDASCSTVVVARTGGRGGGDEE